MTNFKHSCEKIFATAVAFCRKYADRPVAPRSYDHTKFDKWTRPSSPSDRRKPIDDRSGGKEAYQEVLFR